MIALILAGGSGTRFWPVSRRARPKQLVPLYGGQSLLRYTVDRILPLTEPTSIWVCTTELLTPSVRRQLPEVPAHQVLSEPLGRNTAAAIGWAISSMPQSALDQVVAVLPSDHWIADSGGFRTVLASAIEAVRESDRILALGVTPRWPETGYGYLEMGDPVDAAAGLRRVVRFTEKPDGETARRFLELGKHLWNAGIFLFRARTLMQLLERFLPKLSTGLATIRQHPERLHQVYSDLPCESIDTGVMERVENLFTIPLDCGWNDLGSWQALAEILPADEAGNRVRGQVVAMESRNNLIYADAGTVAVFGLEETVVVRTDDSVLVLPRQRAQEVRQLVDELDKLGRQDLL